MYARLLASSSISLATAGGVAFSFMPWPAAAPTMVAMAMAAAAVLAWRDNEIVHSVVESRPRPTAFVAMPIDGNRELTREPDPLVATRTGIATQILPPSDFRKAPPTGHVFKKGDRVEFIFDSWEQGEVTLTGEVEHRYTLDDVGCRVACDNGEPYYVPSDCLVYVGGEQ